MRWIILLLLIAAVYYLYAKGYITPEGAVRDVVQSLKDMFAQLASFFSGGAPAK